MTFKYRALALGCFAAIGLVNTAQAVPIAGELLELYGNLYPQYQNTSFGDAAFGAPRSQMTGGLVAPGVVPATTATPVGKNQLNWVNSYIGFKGKKTFGELRAGYDLQGSLATNVESGTSLLADTRDAFVYVEHDAVGTFSIGQQDTIYKQFGDRVRMLGVSSSNFVSTAAFVSGVGWRPAAVTAVGDVAAGTSSFNTRIGGQLLWISPSWSGVQLGVSYRPDPNKTATQNQTLSSMGINWSNANYYIGLGTETHKDYRSFSGTRAAAVATTIHNATSATAGLGSKDTATRFSVGYKASAFRVAADVSKLKYTEAATVAGKFSSYDTTGWQVSGEYSITPQWTVAANYAKNSAGNCSLLGGAVCTTTGQGGTLLSLGGRYDLDKNIGFFAIYGATNSNDSANFSATGLRAGVGGKMTNLAVGVQVKF
jgi:predicted porin